MKRRPGDGSEDAEPGVRGAALRPIYRVDERPASAWETLLYAWQHTLVDISPFVLPLAVAAAIGMTPAEEAALISAGLFAMGIATLLQTTIGNRLPIVQGPSATLTGTLAPVASQFGPAAMWGGAFLGGLVEAAAGAARLPGALRRFFPPAVAGAVVVAIAAALGGVAARLALGDGTGTDLGLAAGVIALIGGLQVGLRRAFGGLLARASVFLSVWIVGLGAGGVLGRVDWGLVASQPWFAPPTLFPYGGPGLGWEFPAAAVLAILAGYVGSTVESLGDYAATCAVVDERLTIDHMNRGIAAEGLGSALATLVGGLPVTSYTQNIGILATTRVASRAVVQGAAGILILYGVCPKFGALLAAMPRPVLGGVFLVVCGMIAVAGVRLLAQGVDDPSEQLVAGTTLVAALSIPAAAAVGPGAEWLAALPALPRLVLSNAVVLAVTTGVTLHALLVLLPASRRGRGAGG